MSTGAYLAGAAYFLPTLGATLGATVLVVRTRYGHLAGVTRALAFSVVFTSLLLLAEILPAVLGILTRLTPLIVSLLAFATARLLAPRDHPPTGPAEVDRKPAKSGTLAVAIALCMIGGAATYELAIVVGLITQPPNFVDMLTFHLPDVARFIQTGTVWRVDQFLPGSATAQYPNNGELTILSLVLPWHDLAFVRFPGIAFLVLTGAAVYALGLELGATRAGAAMFAAVTSLVPAISWFALGGLPDVITVSMVVVGVMFLVRHARSDRDGELLLAGLALGISLGTKWYGLTDGAVVVVVWAAATLMARRRPGALARDGARLVGAMALGGGFWMVRNLIESGNPIYPKAVSIFGVHLFAGSHGDLVDQSGYTIADFLGRPGILRRYIFPGFKLEVGIAGFVILAGLALVLAKSMVRLRQPRRDRFHEAAALATGIAVVGMCIVYVITPGSAIGVNGLPVFSFVNIRWLTPPMALGGAVCASLTGFLPRLTPVIALGAIVALLDEISLSAGVPIGRAVAVGAALAFVSAGAWAVVRHGHLARKLSAPAIVGAVLAILVLGRAQQNAFDHKGYARYDPVFAWIYAHAPSGHRVGFTGLAAGVWPVLPAFGPRLGNDVAYVGDVVRHSVHFPASQSSFAAELKAGRYDLLMIGLEYAGAMPQWASNLGYRLVVRSRNLALYEAPGTHV